MKLRNVIVFGLLLLSLVSLSACHENDIREGKTEVIYELEGGSYQNCTAAVKQYYDLSEGTFIVEPSNVTDSKIERPGYEFMGWYQKKIVNDTQVTYEDEWNFKEDCLTEAGLTLYAYWKKIYNYSFSVCYYNEEGKIVVLGTISNVKKGLSFETYNFSKRLENTRAGYTALYLCDEVGNKLEASEIVHPGGDEDVDIKVFVEYIEGSYKVVRNASELKLAKGDNIYLDADIDLGGEAINFENYKKNFIGNGHTISNFRINYSADRSSLVTDLTDSSKKSLYISLFGNTDGAHIENVTFEEVSVVVTTTLSTTYRIYVAPLSISTKNSSFDNVSFSGTFDYERLPSNFDVEENLVFVTDSLCYQNDGTSTFKDVYVNVKNLKNE